VVRSARPRFVNYRPGRRISIRYSASVEWAGEHHSDETLVSMQRRSGFPEGATPTDVAGSVAGVWRWPHDPALPGAALGMDPQFMLGMLHDAGLRPRSVALTRMTYWPGKRAVIRAELTTDPPTTVFVKIVRPGRTEQLVSRHDALSAKLPVATCIAASADLGIICLEGLPGRSISACLSDPALTPPAPDDLLGVLLRLADLDVEGTPRRTTAAKVASHTRLLKALLPDESAALERFAELYGDESAQPTTTIHGDLHEEQVLAADGRVTGLLDVDDAGPGQLVDDLALLIARVRARARFASGGERARSYERELREEFGEAVDPDELEHRAAGALLGRATAPFRIQARDWPVASTLRLRAAEASLERWARRSGVR
jgi:aminoglycoside phosphotransferase